MKTNGLTRKQRKFVEGMVEHGNGTKAALEAYDTDSPKVASVISAENLGKPSIVKEIYDRITPDMVVRAHASLLDAVKLDYFVFPKTMEDAEITSHVQAQGLTVLNIRPSEKGKLAFFTLPDGMSRGKGIELYHKLHGTFAPDKKLHVHVKAEPDPRIKELAKKLNGT